MSAFTSRSLGIVQILILGLIHIYRWTLGLLVGGQCRFYPSCSAYGLQAIRRHGASYGSLLTARRVARCHPWNPGGFDPVPEIEQRSRS
jgi:putative membrane protein insertion efficiency factor